MTGLALGAMAPDYEYFLRANGCSFTHDNMLFHMTAGLALAAALALIFHRLIKQPLIRHLPGFLSFRLEKYAGKKWDPDIKGWLAFAGGFAVGVLSHLFLDSFTHESGIAVRHIPLLQQVLRAGPFHIPVFKILQHGGGLLGLLILLLYLPAGKKNSTDTMETVPVTVKFRFWLSTAGTAALLLALFLTGHEYGFSGQPLLNLIVACLTAGLAGITAACLLHRRRRPAAGQSSDSSL